MKVKGFNYHCHGVGQNAFHLIWKLKYAKDPFKFPIVRKHCEQFLREIAKAHNIKIFELRVIHDHVHLFVGLPPKMSVAKALQLFKGGSAYKLFRQHPWLRKHFRKGHFWSPGKCFRSVGNVTADTIKRYIEFSQGNWSRVLQIDETSTFEGVHFDDAQTNLIQFMR